MLQAGWARVNKLVEAFAMIFLSPNAHDDVSRLEILLKNVGVVFSEFGIFIGFRTKI